MADEMPRNEAFNHHNYLVNVNSNTTPIHQEDVLLINCGEFNDGDNNMDEDVDPNRLFNMLVHQAKMRRQWLSPFISVMQSFNHCN